jgi:hypothetical protein
VEEGYRVRDIENELIRQAIVARVAVKIGKVPDESAIIETAREALLAGVNED